MKLPIDELLPEIQQALRSGRVLILQAAPGAGKTTRAPVALLEVVQRQVLILEPRRLAARLSAERVAEEMGEECGGTVGYQIRYDRVAGPKTRLKFITEGVFLRLMLSDPALEGIDCVVLDEFHERHIHTDVTLALVRHLQNTLRPDLKLAIMSATLDPGALKAFLPEARILQSEGRVYPVEVEHLRHADHRTPDELAAGAVSNLLDAPGHILVFLPGAAEIRRAAEALRETARNHNRLLLELRADTPAEEQRRVFAPSPLHKIILATNVAETSLTIDGVTAVVDCGLAKIPAHDPWSGLPTLETRPVSQASCIQRAGRAGRTAPGRAVRLYTQHDFATRPPAEKPEIQRLDLSQILLELQCIAERFPAYARFDVASLPWFDAPPETMLAGCRELLRRLGSVDAAGVLTNMGREMSEFPLHPRLSRTLVEAKRLGVLPRSLTDVALLNEGMILRRNARPAVVAHSDTGYQVELLRQFLRGSSRESELVDAGQARRVERLLRWTAGMSGVRFDDTLRPAEEEGPALALLAGFPDRVAQTRTRSGDRVTLALCGGDTAALSHSSVVRDNEFLLALEAEESRGHRQAASRATIRAACGLEKEMLLAGPPEFLQEEQAFYWDEAAERARGVQRLRYGVLILEEKQLRGQDARLEETLRAAVREHWPKPFDDPEALSSLQRRVALLNENGIPVQTPDFSGTGFDQLLWHVSRGRKSFAEIREHTLADYLRDLVSPADLRRLQEHAPETIQVGKGRKVRIHYEEGKPPWVESALQDFFGTRHTPRIAAGRIALVVHLLAPNRRAVQVTQDLEGFWTRHYPELRKALSRRYPRHSWPENPL